MRLPDLWFVRELRWRIPGKAARPLKELLDASPRAALFASVREAMRFLDALQLFDLSELKPRCVAIVTDENESSTRSMGGIPVLMLSELELLDVDAIIVANRMDVRVLKKRCTEISGKKPRIIGTAHWTFCEPGGAKETASKPDQPRRSNAADDEHEFPMLTQPVSMRDLVSLPFMSIHSIDDFCQAYIDPESMRRDWDTTLWISPREPHPFLGEQLSVGKHRGFAVNRDHMRADQDVEMPKPDGRFRVFLVGASTALSVGAPSNGRIIAAYLKDRLDRLVGAAAPRIEVFTAATPQWTSTHERIVIENRVARLAPDLVIALTGAADVFWAIRGQSALEVATDFFCESVNHFNRYLATQSLPRVKPFPRAGGTEPTTQRMVEILVWNARQSSYALNQVGCPYWLALQPTLMTGNKQWSSGERRHIDLLRGAKDNAKHGDPVEVVRRSFAALCRAIREAGIDNLRFQDLSALFDDKGDETYFLDSFHFGDKGNRVIGHALAQEVYERFRWP